MEINIYPLTKSSHPKYLCVVLTSLIIYGNRNFTLHLLTLTAAPPPPPPPPPLRRRPPTPFYQIPQTQEAIQPLSLSLSLPAFLSLSLSISLSLSLSIFPVVTERAFSDQRRAREARLSRKLQLPSRIGIWASLGSCDEGGGNGPDCDSALRVLR